MGNNNNNSSLTKKSLSYRKECPILNVFRSQLKICGQEIIVRDKYWSSKFVSFLVHKQEDIIAASFQLLEANVIDSEDLNLTQCNSDEHNLWSDYYLVSIKKPENSLEAELSRLGFLS